MTSTSTIRVETVFGLIRDQYLNGRYVGKLESRLNQINKEFYSKQTADQLDRNDAEQMQIAQDLSYVREPTGLMGLVAYEVRRLIGN
jgi:hypothetical protein